MTWGNYKSAFDHPYLALLKKAHDEYGLKTQLNCFYRTSFFYGKDEFCLADMTDKYKKEFEEKRRIIIIIALTLFIFFNNH